jgi:hypothetical protein
MIWQNLAGTTKGEFSIGTGNKRVDFRTNNGIVEARHYGGDWFRIGESIVTLDNPQGFEDRDDATISFSDVSKQLTIQPTVTSYAVWTAGVRKVLTNTQQVTLPDADVTYYCYLDTDFVLQYTDTWSIDLINIYAFVCVLYVDSVQDAAVYFGEERHGAIMMSATHLYLHETFGMQWKSGLATGDLVVDASGGLATHAQCSVAGGEVYDEDINITIVSDATPTEPFEQDLIAPAQIPILYRTGATGAWRFTVANDYPVLTAGTGRLAWNEFTGGAWQQTEVDNLYFVLCHIFVSNSRINPVVAVQGQNQYANVGDARTGAYVEVAELSYGSLDLAEMHPISTIIYQTNNVYGNAVKGRVRSTDTGDSYIDWRLIQPKGISNTSEHSALAQLDYYSSGHTGFQRKLFIDSGNPDTDDDGANTGGNGIFQITDLWFNDSANTVYVCEDASTGAAVWTLAAGGGGTGGLSWSKITGSVTAEAGKGYALVATANLTVTLPATPTEGDLVGVVDANAQATAYVLTIARNGEYIHGQAEDLIINTNYSGVELVYVDASSGWIVNSEISGAQSGTLTWQKITGNTTAVSGFGYLIAATGNMGVTLPATPNEGDTVAVCDTLGVAETYVLTVLRNGSNIYGSAEDLVINTNYSGFHLSYVDSTIGWVITTEIAGTEQFNRTVEKDDGDSPYTIVDRNVTVMCDVTSAAMTVNLPTTPVVGDYVRVKDAHDNADANNITVGRNGKTIQGLSEDLIINVAQGTVHLRYQATGDWGIFSIFPVSS